MLLSDRDIMYQMNEGNLTIVGFEGSRLQPSSYDCRLSNVLLLQPRDGSRYMFHLCKDGNPVPIPHDRLEFEAYTLFPGEFVLGATVEEFRIGEGLAGRLEGKSSLGRMGLSVHTTAGFFDPGFQGTATLEITNHGRLPIVLYPGVAIAQMCFLRMTSVPLRSYRETGTYNGQVEPTAPRYRP